MYRWGHGRMRSMGYRCPHVLLPSMPWCHPRHGEFPSCPCHLTMIEILRIPQPDRRHMRRRWDTRPSLGQDVWVVLYQGK